MVSLLTIIYVLVDDWYQQKGYGYMQGKPGVKPEFSDSEVLTLMLAQDFIPYPGETQFMGYMRANHLSEFPKLVDQSQYNRRARALWRVLEALRQEWVQVLGGTAEHQLLLDTKPVPVVGQTRSKRRSDFAGRAAYGYCAARQLHYFGDKLVSLVTLDGLVVVYDLVPANLDEREAAEAVLYRVQHCDIFADKGFIGDDWQADIHCHSTNRIWTTKRVNQAQQNPAAFDALLKRLRERIESTFHQLQNTGRFLERLLAKTRQGLYARVTAKVAALVLRFLLNKHFGIDVLSFSMDSVFNSH
jgi:transposase